MFEEEKIENELKGKLKSFEVSPPNDLWTDIEKDLDSKDRKRLFIIISYASAAVVTLLFTIGGILYLNRANELPKQPTIADTKPTQEIKVDSSKSEFANQNRAIFAKRTETKNIAKVFINRQKIIDSGLIGSDFLVEDNIKELKLKKAQIDYVNRIIPDNISKLNTKNFSNEPLIVQNQPSKTVPNWTVNVSGFPVYSFHTNGLGGSGSIQNESGLISWGAFLSIRRSLNRNLDLETGLSYNPYGQQVNNIYFVSNSSYDPQVISYQGLETSFGTLSIPLSSNNKLMDIGEVNTLETDVFNASSFNSVNIKQTLGYLEVPVFLVKRINTRKYTIQFKGGLVSGFLVNNSMKVFGGEFTMKGKTEGVNRFEISLAGSIGVSIPLSDRINLTIDPTFKYGLRSLNNSMDKTHPFSTYIKFGLEIPLGK